MPRVPLRIQIGLIAGAVVLVAILAAAALVFRDDIERTFLDPKTPFQTYRPPPGPDYGQAKAWALLPAQPDKPTASEPPVDVFFIHPTTFDGGRNWLSHYDRGDSLLHEVMLPNYAGPFAKVGRVFAPNYRQASLYAVLSLRDDARDARRFSYGDVLAAFTLYRERYNQGRPFIIVGVEQGGVLAARLLRDEIGPNAPLRARLAAAYLLETVVPAESYSPNAPIPACQKRGQPLCVVAYATAPDDDPERARTVLERSLVWQGSTDLATLDGRPALCVNPLLGGVGAERAPARLNLGAVAASRLEWGVRPAFLSRQVSAQCQNGVLRYSKPASPSLQPSGSWTARQKVYPFNLFWADLEADALGRAAAAPRADSAPKIEGPFPLQVAKPAG